MLKPMEYCTWESDRCPDTLYYDLRSYFNAVSSFDYKTTFEPETPLRVTVTE